MTGRMMRRPDFLRRSLPSFSRRTALLMLPVALATSACSKKEEAPAAAGSAAATDTKPAAAAADGALTVGFIYVGPKDDYGYNQAHHEGAVAVSKLPGIKIREEEKVPETLD